jgi:hypothetical protein
MWAEEPGEAEERGRWVLHVLRDDEEVDNLTPGSSRGRGEASEIRETESSTTVSKGTWEGRRRRRSWTYADSLAGTPAGVKEGGKG